VGARLIAEARKKSKCQDPAEAEDIRGPADPENAPKAEPSRSHVDDAEAPCSRVAKALGPPGLFPEEDTLAYFAIEAEFYEIIAPWNIVELGWVRELTDGVWDERRLSLAKAVSIKLGRREGIEAIVEAVRGPRVSPRDYSTPPGIKTSIGVMTGNNEAKETYKDCLKQIGLAPDEHSAAIHVARLDKQMRIQNAIDTIRRRRATLLRDIENRRADMAKLLKVASERLIIPQSPAPEPGPAPTLKPVPETTPLTNQDPGAEIDNG
jgi:hypothetical protein